MTAAIFAALSGLASAIWPYVLAGAAALGALFMARRSGEKAAQAKAEQKDMRDAIEIRRSGAEARDAAGARDRGDGLRADDGWRRD